MTVTNALGVLREEGLLTTRQGSRGATVIATPDEHTTTDPTERSEEFHILTAQLHDIRANIRRLATRLDELDERTKDH